MIEGSLLGLKNCHKNFAQLNQELTAPLAIAEAEN